MSQGKNTLQWAFGTDVGRVRVSNEDTLLVEPELGLFVVADGMGGHNAGERASFLAVDAISRRVGEGLRAGTDPLTLLQESIMAAHLAIVEDASKNSDRSDMGTTVVAALYAGGHFLIGHVGDSRAYFVADGAIRPLTTDHSFVAEWIREGWITHAEARTHSARHGLTMALGAEEDVQPVFVCLPREDPGCLLLCSDGLTDMLEDREINRIVHEARSLDEACRNLIDHANEKGGEDNITVVLVRRP